jgi:hydroxymethylglutaryl-CoA synthase
MQPHYREALHKAQHAKLLSERRKVSVCEYEELFQATSLVEISSAKYPIEKDPAAICLAGIHEHQREYINKVN